MRTEDFYVDQDGRPATPETGAFLERLTYADDGALVKRAFYVAGSQAGPAEAERRIEARFTRPAWAKEGLDRLTREILFEGGTGSGDFGHAGRPGQVGGSGPGGAEKKKQPIEVFGLRFEKTGDKWQLADVPAEWKKYEQGALAQFSELEGQLGKHHLIPDDIVNGFSFQHPGYEVVGLKISPYAEVDRVIINGKIVRRGTGEEAGWFTRTLKFETKTAEHGLFYINEADQGKGIAAALSAAQVRLYEKAGIRRVELLANGTVGKYAWALQGFDFEAPGNRDKTVGLLREVVKLTQSLGPDEKREALARIERIEHSWDVARFTINGDKIGKRVLLSGPPWNGVLDLDRNSDSQKVFRAYASQALRAVRRTRVHEEGEPGGMADQDSAEFHRETLDAEDAIFAALERLFGPSGT